MLEATRRCGFVAIVGRPDVGKSTLLNRLLGQKISITANKPQTTRHRILGIRTINDCQIVYVDTPGLHTAEPRQLNRLMNRIVRRSVRDVDLIIWMVEALRWTSEDAGIWMLLQQSQAPVLLAINKIDRLQQRALLLPYIGDMQKKGVFLATVPLCAESGEQVDRLAQLVQHHLPIGEHHFPADQVTDRSQQFIVSELIREKLVRFLGDELPYAVTVILERFVVNERGIYLIHAVIFVERAGQKKIIVGTQGQQIKRIGQAARLEIMRYLGAKVHLELWVKVKAGWADNQRVLNHLGYCEGEAG